MERTLTKGLLIGLSGLLIGILAYGGLTYLNTRVTIKGFGGFLSIQIGPVYALATAYAWVNAVPVQTDDTNFEWINGKPYIYMNITSSGNGTASLANSPNATSLGTVQPGSTYYAKGYAPSNPVGADNCTFTITNDGSIQIDTSIKATNFTGVGDNWTLGATANVTHAKLTAYYTGQDPSSGVVVSPSDQNFYQNLAAAGTIKWDFRLDTPTVINDGYTKTCVITITAVAG